MNHLLDTDISESLNRKTSELAFSLSNGLRIAAGALSTLIGAICFTLGISFIQGSENIGLIIFTLLFGLLPVAGGVQLIRGARKRAKIKRREFIEKKILSLAMRKNGKITPGELAMYSSLSIEKAREELDLLQAKGVLDISVTAQGHLVYELRDMPLLPKQNTVRGFLKNVLDIDVPT